MLSIGRYGTNDMARATPFYDAIAGLLGATRVVDNPGVVGWQAPGGNMFLIGTPFEGEHAPGNGNQMGFFAASRDVVDKVHAKALEMGGKCAGAPGVRGSAADDPNGLYAAYFRDLDGNKMCVLHMPARA